jgi:hypothetical protein
MNYKLLNLEDFDEGSIEEKRMADTMMELDGTVETVKMQLEQFSPIGSNFEPLLKEASTLRKNYLKDIFEDHQVVEINHSPAPEEHRKFMASVMIRWINHYGDKSFEFTRELDEETITTGRLSKDITIHDKTFRKGSRTTRMLNYFAERRNDYRMKTKFVGNFQPQRNKQKVRLVYSPWAILRAGEMSMSCVSPNGENEHSVPTALGYKNMFVAMDDKLDWRAWIFVDPATKTYNIGQGYPRENYEAQHAVMTFMREKGYEIPNNNIFETPGYTDQTGIFLRISDGVNRDFINDQTRRLNLPNYMREKDIEFDEDNASKHDWQGFINSDRENHGTTITFLTECEWCDRISLWGNGEDWCGYCDGGAYCDLCEDALYYELDQIYSRRRDETLCISCYKSLVDAEKDTVRMEHTAAYFYEYLEKFLVDKGGDEQDLTKYYEEMPDAERDYVMRKFTSWVIHDGIFDALENALKHKGKTILTEKNLRIYNEHLYDIEAEILDFHEYRWIDGNIEV